MTGFKPLRSYHSNGTNHASRQNQALSPATAPLDDRDLLAILHDACAIAGGLTFGGSDAPDPATWAQLFGADPSTTLPRLARFAQAPDLVPLHERQALAPPHVALILVVAKLLLRARGHQNQLTAQHLDQLYTQWLKVTPRAPEPNQVHVQFQLHPDAAPVRLPAGTRLDAGSDDNRALRQYETDRDLVVTHAQVARIARLHSALEIFGLAEARRRNLPQSEFAGAMLALALGVPEPGDPIPAPEGTNFDLEAALRNGVFEHWFGFAASELYLEFHQLRRLVVLLDKRVRTNSSNDLMQTSLSAIAKRRLGDAAAQPTFESPDPNVNFDTPVFEKNLTLALGQAPDFSGLADVDVIDDLLEAHDRIEVKKFLENSPYSALTTVSDGGVRAVADDFLQVLANKRAAEADWAEVIHLLNLAGSKRTNSAFQLQSRDDFVPTAFETNLAAALPDIPFADLSDLADTGKPSDIQSYLAGIEKLSAWLFMSATEARFLFGEALSVRPEMSLLNKDRSPEFWQRVDTILTEAYRARRIQTNRVRLEELRAGPDDDSTKVRAVLSRALDLVEIADWSTVRAGLDQYLRDETARDVLDTVEADLKQTPDLILSEPTWAKVLDAASLAGRARLGTHDALPLRQEWKKLSAFPSVSESAEVFDTFGTPQTGADARIGWGITAPDLLLTEGHREITLTLSFDSAGLSDTRLKLIRDVLDAGQVAQTFAVEVSTADGWLTCGPRVAASSSVPTDTAAPLSLTLTVTFDPSDPALTASAQLDSAWPVLRLRVFTPADQAHPYPILKDLTLLACDLAVTVGEISAEDPKAGRDVSEPPAGPHKMGLRHLVMSNDQGVLDASRPVEPFTYAPTLGSKFAIAHQELSVKRISRLNLGFEWQGAPQRFSDHYAHYESERPNTSFQLVISSVENNRTTVLSAAVPAFHRDDARAWHSVSLDGFETGGVTRPPKDAGPMSDPTRWGFYLSLALTGADFGHSAYPAAAARALWAQTGAPPKPVVIEHPYTPKLKALSIAYAARTSWPQADECQSLSEVQFVHFHPFGHETFAATLETPVKFLPDYAMRGALYLGLSGVSLPERLTLLVQMEDGSSDPSVPAGALDWAVLDGTTWHPLDKGEVCRDTTRGFISSGIVEIDLPDRAAPSLLFEDPDLIWLRVSTDADPRSVCRLQRLGTQAVSATYAPQPDNDPANLATPLPPLTITSTVAPIAGLAEVLQPVRSFGGRPPETTDNLRLRVSERLRHRDRAVMPWDYERLVLDRFPHLHKVKCCPSPWPGAVQVVVVPRVSPHQTAATFEPKTSTAELADIQTYVQGRAPVGVRVTVTNAQFTPVLVRVAVQPEDGVDHRVLAAELNAALQRHLSPWAFDDREDIEIGGAIWANSLIDILSRQPGVRYVRAPKLFRFDDVRGGFEPVRPPTKGFGGYHVPVERPDEILVSARQHEITILQPGAPDIEELVGLGYMKIGLDFVVAENAPTE